MKIRIVVGYNDKKLSRYVKAGEELDVDDARGKEIINTKDYKGRNIAEEIKEKDNKKTKATEEKTPGVAEKVSKDK